jgi:acyl-[acyl-carrier-protein]-phospholipid O-acyltransferase/long-chain-fatty-acid--[acyl-carrier-protein] ligase
MAIPAPSSQAAATAPGASTAPSGHLGGLAGHLQASAGGAAIDNLFRTVIGFVLTTSAAGAAARGSSAQLAHSAHLRSLAMVLFMLPFIVLSATAGSLGDRIGKQHLIRGTRLIELAMCGLGAWAYSRQSIPLLLTALVGLATASAIFAPVKYAVLPELCPDRRLVGANAALAAITMAAILAGIALAALADPLGHVSLVPLMGRGPALALIGGLLCLIGLHGAWRVPPLPPQAPDAPIAPPWAVVSQIAVLRSRPGLLAVALGLAGFWAMGAVAQTALPGICDTTYHCSLTGNALLNLVLGVGIIIGALLTPLLMSMTFPIVLPLAASLAAGSALLAAGLLAHRHAPLPAFALALLAVGVGAGCWETALAVLLQRWAPADHRNLAMAGAGLLASLAMAVLVWIFSAIQAPDLVYILLGLGMLPIVAGIALLNLGSIAAGLLGVLLRLVYRVEVIGDGQVPAAGGCLLVCNHVSYSDGVILAAALRRRVRFLVYRSYLEVPVVGWGLRWYGVIPIAAEDARRTMAASIAAAVAAARAGEVVAIFPEGKISRSGQLDAFRAGLERIARRAQVPIIPAHLHGLWGGPTSRSPGRGSWRLRQPVVLRFGAPLASDTPAAVVRGAVEELAYRSAEASAQASTATLVSAWLAQVRRHPRRIAVRDAEGELSAWRLLVAATALRPMLGLAAEDAAVGIVLPPGRAGTIANAAVALAGRCAVNLNHTAGSAQMEAMCRQAGVRTIISARRYLARISCQLPAARVLLLEDLLPRLRRLPAVAGALLRLAGCVPQPAPPAAAALLIFSSGSTGDPKGVPLSHRQVLWQCRAIAATLALDGARDGLLSPLPLFHSFGLVPGMWLGLVTGLPLAAQADPADGAALGVLAARSRATFLISTPTLVRGYLRRIAPEQLRSLRLVVVGAERCPLALKEEFRARFGIDLLEGYGCTELGPVVAFNLPDIIAAGVREERNRDGTVGRPLPGIQVLCVHPALGTPLPPGAEGLLLVRSPSRMQAYLHRPDLTALAIRQDAYATGDIGIVDVDGFVTIRGRLARFAKIAGEMVPLDRIEAILQAAAQSLSGGDAAEGGDIAVAAVPDPTRGERLIVLHHGWSGDPAALLAAVQELPPLWRPRLRDVYTVAGIPRLGTGKRDLAGIRALALDLAGGAERARAAPLVPAPCAGAAPARAAPPAAPTGAV